MAKVVSFVIAYVVLTGCAATLKKIDTAADDGFLKLEITHHSSGSKEGNLGPIKKVGECTHEKTLFYDKVNSFASNQSCNDTSKIFVGGSQIFQSSYTCGKTTTILIRQLFLEDKMPNCNALKQTLTEAARWQQINKDNKYVNKSCEELFNDLYGLNLKESHSHLLTSQRWEKYRNKKAVMKLSFKNAIEKNGKIIVTASCSKHAKEYSNLGLRDTEPGRVKLQVKKLDKNFVLDLRYGDEFVTEVSLRSQRVPFTIEGEATSLGKEAANKLAKLENYSLIF